jgi:hypothetical protein
VASPRYGWKPRYNKRFSNGAESTSASAVPVSNGSAICQKWDNVGTKSGGDQKDGKTIRFLVTSHESRHDGMTDPQNANKTTQSMFSNSNIICSSS